MLTPLDEVIAAAFAAGGRQEAVNKVYLCLLRNAVFVPITKESEPLPDSEPFRPLFTKIDEQFYMVAFDTLERLEAWAGDSSNQMDHVMLSGKELITGINDNVYLALNPGMSYYKEFSPDEIKHLKKIVARIDALK